MGHMESAEERDWVVEQGEALLRANPKLAESIDRQLEQERVGTLKTVDTDTVRRVLTERAAARRQSP